MGFLHGELTTLLWGGAFGFVWAYVMVARAVAAWSNRHPEGALEVGADTTLLFRTARPPLAPAFFHWRLLVEGEHSPRRRFVHHEPLQTPTTAMRLTLKRGHYRVVVKWQLVDVFGLSRHSPRVSWQAELVVVPPSREFPTPPPPPTRSGRTRVRRTGREGGDPFDVRPYTPGDDLRRLHWPLYAHSDTPFVRTAEPTPPPTGHQFVVLDTEAAHDDELDPRLEALVAWLTRLESHSGWTLVIPAANARFETGEDPRPSLAALVPTPLPEPSVSAWPETVTVVTGPSSQGAARLAQRLEASRRRFHALKVEPSASPTPSRPWWQR